MKSEKRHIGWLLSSMMMLLALVACSEDSSNGTEEPQGSPLRLSSVTRANSPIDPTASNAINMYVMTQSAQYSFGTFSGDGTIWTNSNISVKEHEQYYMYGFMPGSYTSSISAESTDLNGDYSRGADLTLTGLPMFPTEDICVVVGVQKVSTSQTNSNYTPALEGNYGYLSGLNSENYVNLLMDHLYGQLILQFNVDADYNDLRKIKLKTVTLTSSYGETVNATIKLRAGNGLGVNSVAYSKNSGDSKELNILKSTDTEKLLTTTATNVSFGPYNCAPCTFDANGTYLTLTCTYDVYNTAGTTVLRANCTATNKLKISGMDHGVKKTVTLTVAPTYLYMLSDDDLNNPTIKLIEQ